MDENSGDCEFPTEFDIWHSLKRIQAATYRTGFNFWDIFRDLEPSGKRITAEHKFLSVLCGPLKNIIGLSDQEILNIAAYFRTCDGRVDYDQFCRAIHDSDPPEAQVGKKPEEDDPYEAKTLDPKNERSLKLIMSKMACTIDKPLILRPYFQEYQTMKKRSGLVSNTGFFRILDFLGFKLAKDEAHLIISKYGSGPHDMKYAAFLKDLVAVKEHLKARGILDTSGKLLPIYRNELPTADISQLPCPDMFAEVDAESVGLRKVRNDPRYPWKEIVLTAFAKLKQHVKFEQINIRNYFMKRDPRGTGRIPLLYFQQAIEWIKYSRKTLSDLYLSPHEKKLITQLYIDPEDYNNFLWMRFAKDVYEDMDLEEVANWPVLPLVTPPKMLIDRLPKIPLPTRDSCVSVQDEFFEDFHKKLVQRNVDIRQAMKTVDREKKGLIKVFDFAKAMKRHHFLFTNDELQSLFQRFGVGNGIIDYEKLIKQFPLQIEKRNVGYGVQQDEKALMEKARLEAIEQDRRETNIVEVLAKIKRIIICSRVKMEEELKNLDDLRTGLIPWDIFQNVLETCGIPLTDKEKSCLRKVFQKDDDPSLIEYTKFYPTVDEESNMPCLTRMSLHEAMRYEKEKIAKAPHEFVNFDDRIRISQAVKKLSKKVTLGEYNLFKAADVDNTGLVDKPTFLQLLYDLGVLHLLTLDEIDSMMKGFGYEINSKLHIDYQDFLNALDIVFRTEKAALHL